MRLVGKLNRIREGSASKMHENLKTCVNEVSGEKWVLGGIGKIPHGGVRTYRQYRREESCL